MVLMMLSDTDVVMMTVVADIDGYGADDVVRH